MTTLETDILELGHRTATDLLIENSGKPGHKRRHLRYRFVLAHDFALIRDMRMRFGL